MNATLDLSIVGPALVAGLLVTATHVPLGMQVLDRGIVFIDIAIAQIAGTGVIAADLLGFEHAGGSGQLAALATALAGALFLTWTDKRWPDVQEAIIGTVFVLAATAGILLLAGNVHGGEHLKELLVGQILWVRVADLWLPALIYVAALVVWFAFGARLGRAGFYVLFALVVTLSVQLVGVYLVFATLIIPALATQRVRSRRLLMAYACGVAGYALGLALSVELDLPSGAAIVWALAVVGVCVAALLSRVSAGSPDQGA
ncbi:MAG TPA: metal ABC transporter permease [Burkholderiaceae bacterium]|nr:metal ABC transporter permease [Burkholderiaceae bacterium]